MLTRFRSLLASGAVVVAASLLVAQERPANPNIQSKGGKVKPGQTIEQDSTQGDTANQRTQQQGTAQHAAGRSAALDQYVLSCVISQNEGEIEISKIAQQRASSPKVKQFAAEMIKDHTAFLEKLRAAQGDGAKDAKQGQNRQRRADRQQAKTDDATATDDVTANPEAKRDSAETKGRLRIVRGTDAAGKGDLAMRGHSIPLQTLISVSEEIHERCEAALKQELEQKEGADFDMMFMGVQCGAHLQMANSLDVLQKHVSQDLQHTLSEGADTARQHLTHAKDVAMKLEGNSGAQAKQQRDTKTSRKKEPLTK